MSAWPLLRIDELLLGDRIEWPEFHFGPMTVTHLGRAGRYVEMGTDQWSQDILASPSEMVAVDMSRRPPLSEPEPVDGG